MEMSMTASLARGCIRNANAVLANITIENTPIRDKKNLARNSPTCHAGLAGAARSKVSGDW
jgi:hypothetical protein